MASTFFRKEGKKTALFPGARGSSTTRAQAFPFAGVLMDLISFPQLSSPLAQGRFQSYGFGGGTALV